ncbi:glucokinase [Undibacterium sp. SXout11W]|uniref:glucokinase n=1 Tax=Undibacterium sp. SXout11W TaxID=3413050 RepID=UPI003BEFB638
MHDLTTHHSYAPRLLADIGGTNARFALEFEPHHFVAVSVLACAAYADPQLAINDYLSSAEVKSVWSGSIDHAAIAIANPVDGDVVSMTNNHWTFSISALKQSLQLQTLVVVNDFTALAMALPHLEPDERVQVGCGVAQKDRVIGLIGPGTGLGVSGIIPNGNQWIPLSSEGGHVSFSPANTVETDLLEVIWQEFPHVSAERLISGMGLELLYRSLQTVHGLTPVNNLSAAEISHHAIAGSCTLCVQAVELFCAMLGTVAGNLALTLGATGGVYIGGGIVPKLGSLFFESAFRQRFEAKGRFSDYLAQIPTYLITAEYPAFLGVSAMLTEKLLAAGTDSTN